MLRGVRLLGSGDPGLNELQLQPYEGGCLMVSDGYSLGYLLLDTEGNLTAGDHTFGTWTGDDASLTLCAGTKCVSCAGASDASVGTCQGTWGCEQSLPFFPELSPQNTFLLGKDSASGDCEIDPSSPMVIEADGSLVAEGFPIGTWSGTEESVTICTYGECGTCGR